MADRYAAALDMAEWGDGLGCVTIAVSEHHSSPDGYLPSPLPMLAAMAARTTNVRFMVAALIAPFYDPLRLAEDLVVLDHLSRGRVDVIVAGGYVQREFAMFDVPTSERARRVTEAVATLKAAFTGEPFEHRGRTVQVTPAPFRPGGPGIMLGGSSEAAARRAARIADGFLPSVPEVWDFYRDEVQQLGPPRSRPQPDRREPDGRAGGGRRARAGSRSAPTSCTRPTPTAPGWRRTTAPAPTARSPSIDELRAQGQYRVLTPDEHVAELQAAPFPFAFFHPLCGGIPPELAWTSLRLFEQDVMPAFA